jgi:hypothetical protein
MGSGRGAKVSKRERGAMNFGCVVGLVVFVLALIVAMKAIPPKIAVAELDDFCVQQAQSASLSRNTNERIAYTILSKAQQLSLPVTEKSISVTRDTAQVHILVRYQMVIEFPLYTYTWDVEHKADRILF